MKRPLAAVSAAVSCWLCLVTACAAPAPRAATPEPVAPPPTPTQLPASVPISVQTVAPQGGPGTVVRPIGSPIPANLPLSVVAGRSGSDLRLALDVALQENAFLTASAMQAARDARLDELIGISAVLDEDEMGFAEIIGALKGQPAAQTVVDTLRARTADLIDYTEGRSSSATPDLDRQRSVLAGQLATAGFSQADAEAILQQRTQTELALADSVIGHDTAQAVQRLTQLQSASDDLGRPLAAALAVQVRELSPANTEGADVDLRLHLVSDIVESVYFTGAGLDAGSENRSADARMDVGAAGQADTDVANQLGGVYGSDVSASVADRLRGQTDAFVAAASGGDRHQAAEDIDRLRAEIDALLSGANPLLAPGLLTQELRASDQPLLSAADAFAARDFGTAYARLHLSAKAAEKPADTVALAMVDRYPGRYLDLPGASINSGDASRRQPGLAAGLDLPCDSPAAPRAAPCPQAGQGSAQSQPLRAGAGRTQPPGHR